MSARRDGIPNRAKRIDASGKYVVPGFIDTNVHISGFFHEELFPLLLYSEPDAYIKYGYFPRRSTDGAEIRRHADPRYLRSLDPADASP